jgi:general secretion pathway protein G
MLIGNYMKRHFKIDQSGFSMLELMIVLVILSLLAALVGPALYNQLKPAKESVTRAQIENFIGALDSFFVDNGRFPTTTEGLQALRTAPSAGLSKWHGPYLKKNVPEDPWGHAFIYRSPGRNGGYEIISYGADGKEGGDGEDGDINSWSSK